jgi:hypothetical protein
MMVLGDDSAAEPTEMTPGSSAISPKMWIRRLLRSH